MGPPGIMWASSRITHPERLSVDKYSDWYENKHIKDVLVLPGAVAAVKYQAVERPVKDGGEERTYSGDMPWLVVYELPDMVGFRESDGFKNMSQRNPPTQAEIDTIYMNTQFAIRFYEEVQRFEGEKAKENGALEPPSDIASTTDFDKWYREEHIPLLSRMPGFIRSRRYEVKTAYTIKQLQPSDDMQIVPKYYALHEFGGEALPWKQIEESVGTEWAKKVMGSVQKAEVGWYKVKRVYPESEWGSVGN
ncbi:hypothetical protein COCC4DRAFT_81629 [Bipolaris maydis ATCC 48331]|uniref:EthD domain-containing protein n=1 Tax=Cochliobolus heterostrophus (strain C4 / ATCC 48331 / race T) TaxID=665024 RepID=N4X860_COCH4|nr:uncharacterized protein COCC4DRAFT_81629 [Bipolaris maydis ATCC 48331]ENI04658.1 hypothetical protein COCC4DRAFT_81629 [Bipolaris maydis ATCC 48331]